MDVKFLFRRVVYGVLGGLTGGLLFGPIMAISGVLPYVAMLIGQTDEGIGFGVHMGIALLFGSWFGLIFAFVPKIVENMKGSAIWGTVYGFVWWILGGLTLMPAFLGMPPQFSNAGSEGNMWSLLGHLIYGLSLGLVHGYLGRVGFMAGAAEERSAPSPPPKRMVPGRPP